MTATTPKRRWFRFHLLTAVLMMLAFGLLLWKLFRTRWHGGSMSTTYDAPPISTGVRWTTYGWPIKGAVGFSETYPSKAQGVQVHLPLIYDLACWLAILLAVAFQTRAPVVQVPPANGGADDDCSGRVDVGEFHRQELRQDSGWKSRHIVWMASSI